VTRRRLVFVLNSFAPYGAETFVLNHIRHADRARYDIDVCALGRDDSLAGKLGDAGARVHLLHERHRFDPRMLARLYRLVRGADVVQAHIGYATIVAELVGRAARVPAVVCTEQTVRRDKDYTPWIARAMDATFRLAHQHVYISRAVRDSFAVQFPDLAGERAPIVSNGIDALAVAATAAEARAAVRAELGLGEGDFAFISVARLTERKGQRFAIEGLAVLAEPRARLILVGGGPDEAALRQYAAERGVANLVRLLGQRLDVHRLLGGADAFVHPALVEGLGIAVLEGMACGLPTIATRVDGLAEFVTDETAWPVAASDAQAVAAAMRAVLPKDDAVTARAERGRALVLAEHDIRASVAAYEALYERLLGRRPSPEAESVASR